MRAIALGLITIGVAAAALCGGVSLFLGMSIFLSNDMSDPENLRWLLHYVLLGGVPAVVGMIVAAAGMLMLRRVAR